MHIDIVDGYVMWWLLDTVAAVGFVVVAQKSDQINCI